jgi:hypothetical protein
VAPTNTGAEADRLAAWLNSTWIRAVALVGAVPAASGFHRFSARTVSRIPLPREVTTDPALSEVACAARRGEAVQEDLDALAARHLALNASDRRALLGLVAGGAAAGR